MKLSKSNASWRRWNVAVTGVNARAESPGPGCAVARCLREHHGFLGQVVGLGYDILDAGLYARDICHSGYLIPYPSSGEGELLARIKEIHAVERLDAIVPCLDAEILNFIAIERDLLEMGIRMLIPSRAQFQMRAKNNLAEFCRQTGVDAPESKTITNPDFFDTCESDGWHYPLMVKGIFYDAVIAHNPLQARAIFAQMISSWGYPALVQKLVKGDELNLSGVGDGRGGLLAPVMMRKRAITEKGKAWAGVSVVDEALEVVATKLIRALRWRGPFEVEVMRTNKGVINLIEINPRFPSWIYLSHAVGRNLPIALLRSLAQDTSLDITNSIAPPTSGTFFIRYAQELIMQVTDFETLLVEGGISSDDWRKQTVLTA